jgi:flagellar hook-associated protein 3 FlgL
MTRVATFAQSQSLLASTLRRQSDVADGQLQVTTGKKSTQHAGYAPKVSAITFARAAKANAETYVTTNNQLTTRLDITAQQLTRVYDAAVSVRESLLTAVANGQATAMIASLDADTKSVVDALNGEFDGQYIFGGVRGSEKPVTIAQLSDLVPLTSGADAFQNDSLKASLEVSEGVDVTFGQLADEIGAPLMDSLRRIAQLHAASPLQGQLSIAQDAALKAEIQALDAAIAGIVDQQAVLGINARKVDDYAIQAQTRADDLEVFVGDIEDVNMAEALTRLSNDRTALEASYKVTGELAKLSLLNFI